jgi:hypothetical protein
MLDMSLIVEDRGHIGHSSASRFEGRPVGQRVELDRGVRKYARSDVYAQ